MSRRPWRARLFLAGLAILTLAESRRVAWRLWRTSSLFRVGVMLDSFCRFVLVSGFELDGCQHAKRGVASLPAVPDLQILEDRVSHTLLADAQARGWIDEADRHRRLLHRLDTLIANTP